MEGEKESPLQHTMRRLRQKINKKNIALTKIEDPTATGSRLFSIQ
jgi:hypothetical protein